MSPNCLAQQDDSMGEQAPLQSAIQAYKAGRWAEAYPLLQEILAKNPADAQALNLMSMLALNTGNVPQAIHFSTRALEIRPREAAYWNNLGNALKTLGQTDDAIRQFRMALQCDKNCFD